MANPVVQSAASPGPASTLDAAGAMHPVSLVQEGLWVAESVASDHGAYNECVALRLRGRLDVASLESALGALVDRHPALRSRFIETPAGLMQQTTTGPAGTICPPDLVTDSPGALQEWIRNVAHARFDLGRGPLFRVRLCRLGPDDHALVVVVHHLIADGWSLGVFRRDLSACYAAALESREPALPVLTEAPSAYASRQRADAALPAAQRDADYWRSQLVDRPRASLLPAAAQASAGLNRLPLSLRPELAASIAALARQEGTTSFVILFSAFAVALAQVADVRDLVIATDFADRTSPALEPMIGLFVNQLPLRLRLGADHSARAILRTVHAAVVGALVHKNLPYPLIARSCREPGGAPAALFEAKFVLHSMPAHDFALPGLSVHEIDVPPSRAKFPLLLELWSAEPALKGEIQCQPLAQGEAWIARLRDVFVDTAQRMVDDPAQDLLVPVATTLARAPVFKPTRRPVTVGTQLVHVRRDEGAGALPPCATPSHPGVDLLSWLQQPASRELASAALVRDGALLLRGFKVDGAAYFAQVSSAIGGLAMDYVQCSTPRTPVLQGVYTSTEYPADQEIFFHNENSYASAWPAQIAFWCDLPARAGGATPIADCRKVLASIPEAIRKAFEDHGLRYRRVYSPGLGIPWQTSFGVSTREELQARLSSQGYGFEWRDDGSLVTYFRAPAVIVHPASGERSWFNHASLFHRVALPESLRRYFEAHDPDSLAVSTSLGDGRSIPDDWIEQVRHAYRQHAVRFDWCEGDILVLDNRLTAHAREPYTPPRRILVSMSGESGYADQDPPEVTP